MTEPSGGLVAGFVVLAVGLAAAFVAAVGWTGGRRQALLAAGGAAAWLGVTGAAAAAGRLTFDSRPPTMPVLVLAAWVAALWLGLGPVGKRLGAKLPLAVLVGVQGFRLPLELLMHRAYTEGLMPVQMSYEGLNWDILTGASALVVAALLAAGRMPLGGVRLWNYAGAALLLNILTVALLSAPGLDVFDAPNVWITGFPFVWLPSVMVVTAIAGHIIIFRRLRETEARR
jgi:hypothetical protein